MAKVPLPERGQPLDVTYLYQLIEAVNDLSTNVASKQTSKTLLIQQVQVRQRCKPLIQES
jgi:hypothetical protein